MPNTFFKTTLWGFFLTGLILCFSTLLLSAQEEAAGEPLTHVVQAGENLYRISLKYGIDLEDLITVNSITDRTRIFRGQVLVIPGLTVPDESAVVENPLIAGTPATHIVQPGENLNGIARRYGMTLDQLMAANHITNANLIYKYQELQVWTTETVDAEMVEELPEDAPAEIAEGVSPETNIVYTVQAGEHLAQIARRHGINWTVLARINNITDPNHVYAGQELIIPALNAEGGIIDMGIITAAAAAGAPAPTISSGKQIVVDLSSQRIYAYEDGVLMRTALVSSGLPATPTVTGDFTVRSRIRSQTMTGPGYSLPNVEWVQYFYQAYAIHGTYWHNNFGSPMSHGCVNLTNEEAEWFWNFAAIGTPVHVQS